MVKYRLSTFGTSCNWPRVISPTPGRSTLITSAPNHASNCVQVGPDWTWVKSRMRTPFSAFVIIFLLRSILLSSCPRNRASGNRRRFSRARSLSHDGSLATGILACAGNDADGLLSHFLRSLLCGLRLPMRPLSLPAAGSIAALMRVGLPESMAASTARFSSSGVVAWTPPPPNASIILS